MFTLLTSRLYWVTHCSSFDSTAFSTPLLITLLYFTIRLLPWLKSPDLFGFQLNFLWLGKRSVFQLFHLFYFPFAFSYCGFRSVAGRGIGESKPIASFENVGGPKCSLRPREVARSCLIFLILRSATATNAGIVYKYMRTKPLLRLDIHPPTP